MIRKDGPPKYLYPAGGRARPVPPPAGPARQTRTPITAADRPACYGGSKMKSLAGRLAREGGGYQEREAPHRDEPTTHIDVKFKFRAATITFAPR